MRADINPIEQVGKVQPIRWFRVSPRVENSEPRGNHGFGTHGGHVFNKPTTHKVQSFFANSRTGNSRNMTKFSQTSNEDFAEKELTSRSRFSTFVPFFSNQEKGVPTQPDDSNTTTLSRILLLVCHSENLFGYSRQSPIEH